MMTMHVAEPMPLLEHPLRISVTDSLQNALVYLDRRVVRARRVCAVQAVMMTMLSMHWVVCPSLNRCPSRTTVCLSDVVHGETTRSRCRYHTQAPQYVVFMTKMSGVKCC
jgi:hypothetical protein